MLFSSFLILKVILQYLSAYLICQETGEVFVPSADVLVVQLGKPSPQHVLPAEQRMMGEYQPGHIDVQLVVSIRVRDSHDVAVDLLRF